MYMHSSKGLFFLYIPQKILLTNKYAFSFFYEVHSLIVETKICFSNINNNNNEIIILYEFPLFFLFLIFFRFAFYLSFFLRVTFVIYYRRRRRRSRCGS